MSISMFSEGDRVVVLRSDKSGTYKKLIGVGGTIIKVSGKSVGVAVDGFHNASSSYGCYWFRCNELREERMEERKSMTKNDYPKVAAVELLDDYSKKVYYFKLYDEGAKAGDLVVVNPRSKDNRVLGNVIAVRDTVDSDNYTAEVVAVVDMTSFKSRVEARQKRQDLLNKRSEIERKIKNSLEEINMREFYRSMAEKHKDTNPELSDLVSQLDSIEEALK